MKNIVFAFIIAMVGIIGMSGAMAKDSKPCPTSVCGTPPPFQGGQGGAGGNGGDGGAGGQGGTGVGVGVGIGIAGAKATARTDVDVSNTNQQGQIQGQMQGQIANGGSVKNSGNSFNANVNVSKGGSVNVDEGAVQNSNSNSNCASVGDVNVTIEAPQDEGATGRANDPIVTQNFEQSETTVRYSGEYKVKNTPDASAPPLTTTKTETCMGSSSAGASLPGFGLSFGTTWRDSACVRRLDARELNSLGYALGAKELMCDSDAVRAALKRAGTPCYEDLANEDKRPEDRTAAVSEKESEATVRGYSFRSDMNDF